MEKRTFDNREQEKADELDSKFTAGLVFGIILILGFAAVIYIYKNFLSTYINIDNPWFN